MKTIKAPLLLIIATLISVAAYRGGLSPHQSSILGVFSLSILGTLFFWEYRLSFVFIGSGMLLAMKGADLETFIRFASLDVILFLIGMMIMVALLEGEGFFSYLITLILRVKHLSAMKLFLLIMLMSAGFSAVMGEITSTILMCKVIFDMCSFLDVSPTPLVIASVLATNIGSAATVLGNPVGVLIAARGKLVFGDFLVRALPLSLVVLILTVGVMFLYFRKYIHNLSPRLKTLDENTEFLYLISVPPDKKTKISLAIFVGTIVLMSFHRHIEFLFSIEEGTMLLIMPIMSAGVVLAYRQDKMLHYIEHKVEWASLLFFMFLFAQAGVIQACGIADFLAHHIIDAVGNNPTLIMTAVLVSSGAFSSVLDNTVAVASYVPVIQGMGNLGFNAKPLWWALLFGACYGGNITMIGSTANIVALGLLEKHGYKGITFAEWLKIGLVVGVLSIGVAVAAISLLPVYSR